MIIAINKGTHQSKIRGEGDNKFKKKKLILSNNIEYNINNIDKICTYVIISHVSISYYIIGKHRLLLTIKKNYSNFIFF